MHAVVVVVDVVAFFLVSHSHVLDELFLLLCLALNITCMPTPPVLSSSILSAGGAQPQGYPALATGPSEEGGSSGDVPESSTQAAGQQQHGRLEWGRHG